MSQIQVDNIYNKEATGSPSFPLGANVTGIITATTFKGGAEITSGTISATSVTAASGTFNGPVTIGGTLTYEDVTNIDSVGVITARNGINVSGGTGTFAGDINANGNIVGDNSTNISGVSSVTATTYYGNGASLSGIEAAPTIQAVASGSISADETVILTSDGKVKVISSVTQDIGTAVVADTQSNLRLTNCSYSPTSNKVIVAYKEGGATGQFKIGTVSGSTITFGSSTQFAGVVNDDGNSCINISWNSDDDVFLISFRSSLTDYIYCVVVSGISGTPAVTGIFQIGAVSNSFPCAAYSPVAQKWLLYYSRPGNACLCCRAVTWDGSSISAGSESNANSSGQVTKFDVCYDAGSDRFVAFYRFDGSGGQTTSSVTRLQSDGTLTHGNYQVLSPTVTCSINGITYDSDTGNVVAVFRNNTTSDHLYSVVGKVNATSNTVVWQAYGALSGNAVNENNTVRIPFEYDANSQKFVGFYNKTTDNQMRMVTAVYNSTKTALTLSNETPLESGGSSLNGWYYGSTLDTTNNRTLISFWDGGSDCEMQVIRVSSTDLNEENFVGFSKAAYTNGQTATVKVVGNTTTQSGLTTAKLHYVQNDGTVAPTAQVPSVIAGKALSATSLLIQPA